MATVSSFSAQRVSFEGKLNEVRHRWIYITLAALFIPIGLGVALVLGIGVAAIPGNCVDEPTRFEGIVAVECVVQPTAVQIIGTIVLAVLVLWFALARVRVPRPIAATGGFVGVFTGVFVLEFIISLSGIGYLLMYRWPYYLAYAALIAVPLSLVYRRALRREASTPTVEALGPPHD